MKNIFDESNYPTKWGTLDDVGWQEYCETIEDVWLSYFCFLYRLLS